MGKLGAPLLAFRFVIWASRLPMLADGGAIDENGRVLQLVAAARLLISSPKRDDPMRSIHPILATAIIASGFGGLAQAD